MAKQKSSENQDQKSALDKEIERVNTDFGKGSVISSSLGGWNGDVISTGSLKLDRATGIGGFARGKVHEIYGWESSGKTTITLHAIKNCQDKGLDCLLIDGENGFDSIYAKALGIDVDKLLINQLDEDGAEKCYNIAERLMRTGMLGLVVIDSQTSLLPKKYFDTELGESKLGLTARLMSESVPKIMNAAAYGNTSVIYISQLREKIGVMFGSPETTSGGNALRFYSHMRIEMRKSVLRDKENNEAYANITTAKVVKNKLAVPFKEAKFRINFGEGVDKMYELLDLAIEFDIIQKSGSWYSNNGTNIGQGEDAVIQLLKDNPEMASALEKKILKTIKPEQDAGSNNVSSGA